MSNSSEAINTQKHLFRDALNTITTFTGNKESLVEYVPEKTGNVINMGVATADTIYEYLIEKKYHMLFPQQTAQICQQVISVGATLPITAVSDNFNLVVDEIAQDLEFLKITKTMPQPTIA